MSTPFSANTLPPKPSKSTLYLAGFVGDSIVDGPGLRCTIFAQGCPHACPGCHNPATHAFTGGTACSTEELLEQIKKFPLCRAVTLSGGEPFSQAEAFIPLAQQLKQQGYHLAAYSGFTFEQLLHGSKAQQQLLALLDTLVDGKFILEQRNLQLRFRGSENQRILNISQSLAAQKAVWEQDPRWVGEA